MHGTIDHLTDGRSKFSHTRAGHDDGVAAAMRFLSNAQKFSPVILAKFDVEMLALYL